jgi:hypothetical protein
VRAGHEDSRRRPISGSRADQEQAERQVADALAEALGAEVDVKAIRGGSFRAQLSFATLEEAMELAGRLRTRVVA